MSNPTEGQPVVVVEVSGGVAEVAFGSAPVLVHIIDWDNIRDGDADKVEAAEELWNIAQDIRESAEPDPAYANALVFASLELRRDAAEDVDQGNRGGE